MEPNALSMNANADILRALAAYKQATAALPGQGALSPDVAKAWNVSTGLQAYNLEALHTLFPVLTPIRNMTSRVKGKGKLVEYKAVTNPDNSGSSPWVAEGSAANLVTPVTSDITATYRSFAKGTTVSMESIWAGNQYVDMKSLAVVMLLRQVMIDEENAMLFGLNSTASTKEQCPGALGASHAPTLAAAGTDGSISAATYYFKQTWVGPMGETTPSAATSLAVSATNHVAWTPYAPPAGIPWFGAKLYWSATSGGTYS